jgi:hypothetical protein
MMYLEHYFSTRLNGQVQSFLHLMFTPKNNQSLNLLKRQFYKPGDSGKNKVLSVHDLNFSKIKRDN